MVRDRVHLEELRGVEVRELEGRDVLRELGHLRRADDDAAHVLAGPRPLDRELRRRHAALRRERRVGVRRVQARAGDVARLEEGERDVAAVRGRRARAVAALHVLAAERAAREDAVGQQSDARLEARADGRAGLGRAVLLELAVEQREVVLDRRRRRHAVARAGGEEEADADGVLVAQAPGPDLARVEQGLDA